MHGAAPSYSVPPKKMTSVFWFLCVYIDTACQERESAGTGWTGMRGPGGRGASRGRGREKGRGLDHTGTPLGAHAPSRCRRRPGHGDLCAAARSNQLYGTPACPVRLAPPRSGGGGWKQRWRWWGWRGSDQAWKGNQAMAAEAAPTARKQGRPAANHKDKAGAPAKRAVLCSPPRLRGTSLGAGGHVWRRERCESESPRTRSIASYE